MFLRAPMEFSTGPLRFPQVHCVFHRSIAFSTGHVVTKAVDVPVTIICSIEIASSARGQTSQPGKGRRETSLYIMTVSTALTYYFVLEWRYHTVGLFVVSRCGPGEFKGLGNVYFS